MDERSTLRDLDLGKEGPAEKGMLLRELGLALVDGEPSLVTPNAIILCAKPSLLVDMVRRLMFHHEISFIEVDSEEKMMAAMARSRPPCVLLGLENGFRLSNCPAPVIGLVDGLLTEGTDVSSFQQVISRPFLPFETAMMLRRFVKQALQGTAVKGEG